MCARALAAGCVGQQLSCCEGRAGPSGQCLHRHSCQCASELVGALQRVAAAVSAVVVVVIVVVVVVAVVPAATAALRAGARRAWIRAHRPAGRRHPAGRRRPWRLRQGCQGRKGLSQQRAHACRSSARAFLRHLTGIKLADARAASNALLYLPTPFALCAGDICTQRAVRGCLRPARTDQPGCNSGRGLGTRLHAAA